MSGFLDRLAARAVGEAPLVRPRARSRFEPGAGAMPAAEDVEPAAPPEPPRAEEPAPEPVRRRPPAERSPRPMAEDAGPAPRPTPAAAPLPAPSRGAPSRGEIRVRGEGEPLRALSRPGEERDSIPFPEPRTAAPPLREEGRAERRTEPEEEPEPGRRIAHRGSPPLRETATAAERPAPPAPAERSAAPARIEAPRRETSREAEPRMEVPAERPRRPAPEVEAPPPPAPLRPLVRPRREPAGELSTVPTERGGPLPGEMEGGEPSETVVRVQIGRIDVRAVPPPAPERRPSRPAGPRLTLAEYLRKRREGRR